MFSKIINPKTKRKVSIKGRLGKKILNNYLYVMNGGTIGFGVGIQTIKDKTSGKIIKYIFDNNSHLKIQLTNSQKLSDSIVQQLLILEKSGGKQVKRLSFGEVDKSTPNFLCKDLSSKIYEFTELIILDLSKQHFESLPSGINKLTKLEELYLYGNPIIDLYGVEGEINSINTLNKIVISPYKLGYPVSYVVNVMNKPPQLFKL